MLKCYCDNWAEGFHHSNVRLLNEKNERVVVDAYFLSDKASCRSNLFNVFGVLVNSMPPTQSFSLCLIHFTTPVIQRGPDVTEVITSIVIVAPDVIALRVWNRMPIPLRFWLILISVQFSQCPFSSWTVNRAGWSSLILLELFLWRSKRCSLFFASIQPHLH